MAVEGFIENSSVSSIAYDDAEHSATMRSDTATMLPHDQQQKLAQVETNQSAGALPAATATQPGDRTIVVEENVAKLPSGTSIEKIEIDGDNLVLAQPDGTRVIIENAALHVPTFVMDDVEIPQEALVAALEASNINVAAGPDGTLTATATGSTSGGGNFGEAIPGIGDAGPPIDLLGPTALQFGTLDDEILTPAFVNRGPSISLDGGGSGSAGSIAASDRLVYEHDLPAGSAMSRFSAFAPQQFSFASENEDGSESSEGATGPDATVEGVFFISDPDGLSDIAGISINGINFAPGDLAGKTFAGVYGTLTIVSFNTTTGEAVYSYTLTKAYHSAEGGNGPNTEQDRDIFSLTVTDRGGLSASANLRIDIVDDVPQIRGQASSKLPQAGVDETDFDGDGYLAAGIFFQGLSYTYGADGPGTVTYKLELSAGTGEGGIRSGLYALDNTVDGGQGAEIMLRQEGQVIYGEAGGKTYFTITLDKGLVVLDQVAPNAIWHENTDNPDDRQSLQIENGSLTIVATVTDGDGDTADYGIELGSGVFTFNDDGPQVSAEANGDFSVIHDESLLPQGDADDILFTSIFSSVANPGEDPQSPRLLPWLPRLPLGYAQSATSALTVTDVDYGADGEAKTGAKVFSLTLLDVNGDTASSIDSGLETTEHRQIFLFKEGNLIVGRYDGGDNGSDVSNTGQTPDPAAFAIHIDPNTGIVSMVQYVSLFNDDPDNPDDPISLADTVGRVQAMVTVTDGDGDTAVAKADIGGSIVFQDDGPHIIGVDVPSRFAVTLDETTGNQTNTDDVTGPLAVFANVANVGSDPDRSGQPLAFAQDTRAALNVLPYFGVDGPAAKDSIVFSLTLKGGDGTPSGLEVTDGTAILLYKEGGIIVGRIGGEEGKAAFAIAIDPESGKVSVVEYLSLQHNLDGLNPNDQVSLQSGTLLATVTIKDGDGDIDSASADISGRIQFNDDGPTFTVSTGGMTPLSSIALNLDETIGTTPDRYNTDEQPRDNNGTADDTASTTVTYTTDATSTAQIGHLNTTAGLLANLFVAPTAATVDYGADGKGTFSATLGFVLTGPAGDGFKTNLVVTAVNGSPLANASVADRTVWLTIEGNQIIGRVGRDTQATDDYVAFRISLSSTDPTTAQLVVDQFLPIDHGGSENPSVFDEQISLLMANAGQGVGLQLTVTATDGDNDTVTKSATVPLIGKESSFVSFDDDGPSIAASDARETVNVTYTGIKAGHVDERGMEGQNGRDVLLSGIGSGKDSANGKQNEVNTTQGDIGVGNHWIDPTEVLRFDFVNTLTFSGNGQGATYQHGGHYTVDAASFTIKEVQGNGGSVTVFVQVFNADDDQDYTNDGPALAIDVDKVTVTGDTSYTKTLVYENGNVVGVVISGLNENATVTVNTTDEFDRLVVKNYGGVTFTDTANGHTTSLSGDNFTIGGVKSVILEPVSLSVTHDETAGFGAQLPNGQDDVDPTSSSIPASLKTAADAQSTVLGFAVSTGTASNLFTSARFGTDGAAAGGGLTYQLTKAGGQAFNGEDSGVRTTDGNKVVRLYTDGDIVWGRTADGQNVFALTVDNAGHLWVAQFAAIAHDVDGSTPVDHDDTVSITTGLVFITATATDGDGDKAYAVSPAGLHINFQDDGLTAVADFATTNEGQSVVIDVKNNDLIGADGVDWSKVSHANAVGGTVSYLGDGKFSYTPNAGFDGNGKFTYTITDGDGDTSTATVSVTVEPVVTTPTIVSDLVVNPLLIKEDGSQTVTLTATAGATDVITQVEITGLDATATYVINNVAVSAGSTSYTVTFDGTKQSEPVVITVTPAQDSDVDLTTLSAMATAKDADHAGAGDPGTDSNPVTVSIVVDAVLDDAVKLTALVQTPNESAAATSFSLGLNGEAINPYPSSGAGGADTDASESGTVTLTLWAALPAGVTLGFSGYNGPAIISMTDSTHYTLTNFSSTADLAAAIDALVANVPAGFDGAITGSVRVSFTEANTPAGTVANSGAEHVVSDNTSTFEADFSVTVKPVVTTPTIVSDLAANPLLIKEDGSETVTLTATAGATDVITQVEITGLDATATYVINNVAVSAGSTSYTVTFDGTKQSEPVVITVTPAQDSDVDFSPLSATATAKDADHAGAGDPGTDSNPVTVSIVVDAVLDEYANVGQSSIQPVSEATTARPIDLGLSLDFHETSFSAPSDQPFDITPRDDGSETFTVTITVTGDVANLQLADGTLGTLIEVSGGTWTLAATRSNLAAAVASVQAMVPANFDGTISGTIAAVSTDITTDTEIETPDNSKKEQTTWSLVVDPSVATPTLEVTAGLTDGRLVIKEDSGNTVTLTAGVAVGSDDVLKSATVTGLVSTASYIINGTPVTGTTTYTFSFPANTTTSLITISAAGPQDSDADLGSLAVTVTAADGNNPSVVTPSATAQVPVIVDAVLDEYVDATGTVTPLAYSATAQTVSLGLTAAVMSTGFTHAMGSAGADTDGSENTTATITLNAAASLSLANGASISLAQTGPTTYTLTGTAAQVQDALTKVQVTLPGGFFGTVSGTVSTTSKEANTPASASSTEPDISDNTKSGPTPATFSITISNTTPETVDGTSALTVSEAALDLIKADSDLASGIKTGTNPTSPTETAVDTNGLRFKATGEDIVSIKFANPNVTAPTFDNLASGTPHWTLSSDGRTLTLDFGGQTALILALSGASNITAGSTGDVTVTATLTDSFRHLMPPEAVDVILNGVTVIATDASNDPTTGTVSVHIVDDVPAALLPSELHLENKGVAGTSDQLTAGLNFQAGADGAGTVVFSVPGLEVGATVAATDTDGHLLTLNGQQLYLYYGGPTGTDTTLLVAKTLAGAVGYTVDIDPATGTYTFNPEAKISNGTEVTATTFKDAVGGGNTPFKLIADVGGSQDIVLSTASTTTINTSNNKIGVGNGPTLANSDVIRFDLVNGAFIDQSGSFQYDHTHNLVQRWSQDIGINSGSADFTVTAIIADTDSAFYGDISGEQILDLSVSNIRIYNAQGTLLTAQDLQTQSITLQDTGNSIQINGMKDGYDYEIVTDAAHKFSAIQVQAVSSTGKFSLGLFNYGENSAGTPIELKHNVVGTDGDGDTVNGTIDIAMYPDATAFTGSNPTPTSADDTFIGTSGVDTLNGLGGADILAGLAGNDMLNGGIGDDILYGGSGRDELTGGSGVDTFVIDPSALLENPTLADVILDYDFNNGMGDQVDLTALLDGISSANISNHVRVVEAGPADAATDQLQVSTTGDAASFHTVALLNSDSGVKILYNDEQHHSQNTSLT